VWAPKSTIWVALRAHTRAAAAPNGVWAVKGAICVTFTAHTRMHGARRSLQPVVAAFGPLVDTAWLGAHLGEPDLRVVDCRYVLGKPGAGEEAYRQAHIPGAAFLDVDGDLAAEPGDRGRHPLPNAADFEAAARRAGIGRTSRVVAYDEAGEGGAARLWWLLRHFGHNEVAVLNGGLAGWREEGGALEAGDEEGAERAAGAEQAAGDEQSGARAAGAEGGADGTTTPFTAHPRENDIVERHELSAKRHRLIDARAPERFRGETEPIDAVAGHIPGAVNVPFAELAPRGRFPPAAELRESLGDEPFVAYCGSGITACTLVLAGELAGVEGRLYPGSWSEWSRRGLPVETSETPG
jgi:thiosulfate/3-mercaptopyruvate sulfurtransferase